MNGYQSNYAALAAAAREEAAASKLKNVSRKHERSAEAWERLAEEQNDLKFPAGKARLPKTFGV